MSKLILGSHVSKKSTLLGCDDNKKRKARSTLLKAIKEDVQVLNLQAVQIYTHGPRRYSKNKLQHNEINKFIELKNINLTIHCSHILSNTIWKFDRSLIKEPNSKEPNSKEAKDKNTRVLKLLISEIISAKELNAPLLIHLPRGIKPKMMKSVLRVISYYAFQYNVKIIFENIPAKICPENKGSNYSHGKDLNKLYNVINKIFKSEWGFCIDTAHLWSSAIPISTKADQNKWFKSLKKETLEKITLIHLNGSSYKTWNKNRDMHVIPMSKDDDIYNSENIKNSGVTAIVNFAKQRNIPIILEINRGTEKEVRQCIKLIKLI